MAHFNMAVGQMHKTAAANLILLLPTRDSSVEKDIGEETADSQEADNKRHQQASESSRKALPNVFH